MDSDALKDRSVTVLIMLHVTSSTLPATCAPLAVRDCARRVSFPFTKSHNKVHELIAVKVLHTPLLNTTVVAFKVLPLGSYAPMPVPSPPFKTIYGTGFVEWPSELPLYYS